MDLLDLQWSQVDLAQGFIRMQMQKTKKFAVIRSRNSAALQVIQRMLGHKSTRMTESARGRTITTADELRCAAANAVGKAHVKKDEIGRSWRTMSVAPFRPAMPRVEVVAACTGVALHLRVARAVLVVDDDPPLLNLLATLLRREPQVEVVACRDGEEAIVQLSGRHFDVVLLDLMMPRRNGFDVVDFLREHRPTQLRVVLVLTAATDQFTRRLDPAVVHAVIPKPFDTRMVLDLVRSMLTAAAGGAK